VRFRMLGNGPIRKELSFLLLVLENYLIIIIIIINLKRRALKGWALRIML
jgi:hypothetical protein